MSAPVGERRGRKGVARLKTFPPTGDFYFYDPESGVKDDPKTKFTVRLLELASGKDRPWVEHSDDSIFAGRALGRDSGWLWLVLAPPGSPCSKQRHLLPDGTGNVGPWRVSPAGNFFYFFQGSRIMTVRFDPQRVSFTEPHAVTFVLGSTVTPRPDDEWVWLMKLPR